VLFTRRLIANLRRGFLPQIGPGTNHLSCAYAGNVASAILAALDAPAQPGFRAYNVTRDAPPLLTQQEFFAAFAEALGVRPLRVRVPVPTHPNRGRRVERADAPRHARPLQRAGEFGDVVHSRENPYSWSESGVSWVGRPPFDTRTAIVRSVTEPRSGGV